MHTKPEHLVARQVHQTIGDPAEVPRTCMFKWSFNAKPDIVIHADRDRALCIEAKLESGEGQYPASASEKAIFDKLGLPRVSQTRLQRYLMEDMLGIETEFLFLIPELTSHATDHRMVTWATAFLRLRSRGPTLHGECLGQVLFGTRIDSQSHSGGLKCSCVI